MTNETPQKQRASAEDDTLPASTSFAPQRARLGRFAIEQEIGRGGFGVVYLAVDDVLKRKVALKIPRDTLDEATRKRFVREAEATAALDHPGLVPVYEAGEVDGTCYIATAFCEGGTLAEWIRDHPVVTLRTAAQIVRDLANAMQHAHNRGVQHRDLKPRNVMLVKNENSKTSEELPFTARITDFGMAKITEQRLEDTHSSVILGTPCYMAPEQLVSSPNDPLPNAVDVYSLGVILHELLTGRRPFESDSVVELLDAVRQQDITSVRQYRSEVTEDLETICLSCLRKLAEDRYVSCAALSQDLSSWLNGESIAAKRPGMFTRFARWAAHPQRVMETGLMSILLGISIPVWIIFSIMQVSAQKLESQITSELIPHALALSCTLLIPLAWAGYRTLSNSRRWLKIGLFLSVLNLLTVIGPLLGPTLIFTDIYARHPLAKIITFTFMTMLFFIQTAQYVLIVRYGKKSIAA